MSKNPSVNPTATQTETIRPETTTVTGTDRIDNTTTSSRFGQVKNTITRGAGKVNEGVSTVGRSVSHFASDATKYTRENPGKALAIAIGSGVGIGLLLGATRGRRKNNIFGIISTAVVDAITDRLR
jgi:ElaB/YqjD/DUF883 family membrane-anchored ribosome-binding protein